MVLPPSVVNAYLDHREIVLLRRDDDGTLKEQRVPAEWVSYHRLEKLPDDLRRELRSSPHVRSIRGEQVNADKTQGWVRVSWNDRETRYRVCSDPDSPMRKRGIVAYEADVNPVRRLMVDAGIVVQRPRRVYTDIETDSRVPFSKREEMRLLCWTLVDPAGAVVATGMLNHDTDEDERRLLIEFWRALQPFDQVVAWASRFGDTFDFAVIKARTRRQRIDVEPRRWLWIDQLSAYARMNLAEDGDEKISMKLQDVAMQTVGEGKVDFDASKTWEAWAAGGESRAALLTYNTQDTQLLPKIEAKKGHLRLLETLAAVCGVFADTYGLGPQAQVDSFMLRLGAKHGHRFPTKPEVQEEHEKYDGAFVMEPTEKGIVTGVHVADFAAMYPSIILSWNMSPETKHKSSELTADVPDGLTRAPSTKVEFRTDTPGLLVLALRELMGLRKEWTAKKAAEPPGTPAWHAADQWSTAYKVAANSFYGVIGSATSRFFDRDVAESITQNGVWLIRMTSRAAEARGWRVVYVDTDSIFVIGPTNEQFGEFVTWCNTVMYPEALAKCRTPCNEVKLAYEKAYRRIVFSGKKRYVGLYAHYKGKAATSESKPEVKGLEFRRGDTTKLARLLQGEVIDLFCDDAHHADPGVYEAAVTRAKAHVLDAELPLSDVVLSKSLSKELKEYAARKKNDGTDGAEPAHVQVARELLKRGREVQSGSHIPYVVIDASDGQKVIPAEDYKGECDRFYLWESLVWPPTQRLLTEMFPGYVWTQHDKVRPPKLRTRAAAMTPNQGGLFDLAPPPPTTDRSVVPRVSTGVVASIPPEIRAMAVEASLAVPTMRRRSAGPLKVVLNEPVGRDLRPTIVAIKALFDAHPGARKVEVMIRLVSGAEVELDIPQTIETTPAFMEELQRIVAASVTA